MLSNNIDAIYIHIPFCVRKCQYCDFLSFEYAKYNEYVSKYIKYLQKEISLYQDYEYNTIYIGGGTPSVLDTKYIKNILDTLSFKDDAEVTIEVNPGTVDKNKLLEYRNIGINRLSIGIQSFDDNNLKVLGRIHDSKTAIDTYKNAISVGFKNISIDLMFSLPNETLESVDRDLDRLFEMDPVHFSIYSLIWEEGTPFYEKLQTGQYKITDNDLEAQMYENIIDRSSSKGYTHYEISNFAKKGYHSRHNMKYWEDKKYIGVGLGSSGYIDNIRYKNTPDLKEYFLLLDEDRLPVDTEEYIDYNENCKYKAILSLRMLTKGFEPITNTQKEKCDELRKKLLLFKKGNNYILTRKGLLIANDVMEEFL